MNPKETIPILVKLTPVLAAAGPPALIGVGVGVFLLWLFSGNKKQAPPEMPMPGPDIRTSIPVAAVALTPAVSSPPLPRAKRIMREDLAEALEYGGRSMTRGEAVAALQALGFGKTAAYKALSPDGRFVGFIELAPDGLIGWKG
ncbi:MAG TPA: hypothetical protein VGF13_21745 [Verrucomicrobiae bacterium]|jgi:hypothetical protein